MIAATMNRPTAEGSDDAPLTQLLRLAARGEAGAAEAVLPRVYHELRAIAQRRMAGERLGHTLQATALVNEVWLRLSGAMGEWSDRSSFYAAAATAMRRILVDHARRRARKKRDGGVRSDVPVEHLPNRGPDLDDAATFLELDEAIERLEQIDARAGEIVRLRFYGGLDVDETARHLGTSRRTVLRDWAFARAYLFDAMRRGEESDG
jgi:RNA polymerase sigma factor (TIGR02999 family)